MTSRKLRIAWSVTWGIAFAIVFSLAVRSRYFYTDLVQVPLSAKTVLSIGSANGRLFFESSTAGINGRMPAGKQSWRRDTLAIEKHRMQPAGSPWMWVVYRPPRMGWVIRFPHWLPAALAALLGAVPWLKPRFGLRTLLVATTLIAAVLGLATFL